MNAEITYNTLLRWLNSCDTYEQTLTLKSAAKGFLIDRYDAVEYYTAFCLVVIVKQYILRIRNQILNNK